MPLWWNGRHEGLKIPWIIIRKGSSPFRGTMRKLIIACRDSILKVQVSENNITIFDSYLVKKPKDMESLFHLIVTYIGEEHPLVKYRTVSSIIHEWRVHNLLYSLKILRKRTKDVDLETKQSWYMKLLYTILSPFYFHFK